jgi:hypothetical protein
MLIKHYIALARKKISELATVLNLSSTFTGTDTTITDNSGEGNDATLNSVRFADLDGVNDVIVVELATAIAVTSGDRLYLEVTLNTGGSAETVYWHTTGVSTDVNSRNTTAASSDWVVDFDAGYDSFDASGNVTEIQIGFDGSSSYFDGKIAEIKLIDDDTTTILEHWYCNTTSDATADGLNNFILINSKTGNHGYFSGCTGGTDESVAAAQLAGVNYNKYSWFDGSVNAKVTLDSTITLSGDFSITFDAYVIGTATWFFGDDTGTDNQFYFSGGAPALFINGSNVSFFSLALPLNRYISITLSRSGSDVTLDAGSYGSQTRTLNSNDFLIDAIGKGSTFRDMEGLIVDLDIDGAAAYRGFGENPWDDTIGSNDGTVGSGLEDVYCIESDADSDVDAFGENVETPRPNARVINLIGDGDTATVAADASMDTTKSVAFWYYHDGTANTVIDLGTPTVGSTTTALTASGFTGVTYFVDGASGSTLSTGWNHCIAVSTAALATDTIDISKRCGDVRFYPDALLVADALSLYNAQKADYGF